MLHHCLSSPIVPIDVLQHFSRTSMRIHFIRIQSDLGLYLDLSSTLAVLVSKTDDEEKVKVFGYLPI